MRTPLQAERPNLGMRILAGWVWAIRTAYRPKGTDFSRSGGTNTSGGGTRVSEGLGRRVRLKKQLRKIED